MPHVHRVSEAWEAKKALLLRCTEWDTVRTATWTRLDVAWGYAQSRRWGPRASCNHDICSPKSVQYLWHIFIEWYLLPIPIQHGCRWAIRCQFENRWPVHTCQQLRWLYRLYAWAVLCPPFRMPRLDRSAIMWYCCTHEIRGYLSINPTACSCNSEGKKINLPHHDVESAHHD